MKSFGILRTNPGLTTNIKIMVDSKYGLSLDSINSSPELSSMKFKKVDFNKSNYYDELIPYFYDGLPAETAYTIKYDDDSYTMTTDFANQYDEIYQYGARNIVNNKSYEEEYEYFAPLYVRKKNLPNNFIIFRVDGTGIGKLGRENFKDEVVSKLKTVKLFDLTKKTSLGEWLRMNIDDNEFFPETPFEMSFQRLEFSKWNGIEYRSGGYISKSLFLDDVLEEEKEIFEMEKFIFDGYKNNKVVFPNILNLSFLFDDTPSDEQGLRKWSMNRYYGFYIDNMERVSNISPYSPPAIKSGFTIIDGNILHSNDGDPFVNGWTENTPMHVEFDGTYYKVEKFTVDLPKIFTPVKVSSTNSLPKKPSIPKKGGPLTQAPVVMTNINNYIVPDGYISDDNVLQTVDKWRIISDINLVGKQSKINSNIGKIGTDKKLVRFDGTFFDIEDFDRSDVWIIEVDGIYHNLVRQLDGSIMLSTDYGFEFSKDFFRYFVNRNVSGYTTTVSIKVDANNTPKSFPIYRLNFSDVKDFDTRIVDTEPSKFEYDVNDEIVYTDETKLYFTDHNSSTLPRQLDDFVYKDKVVNIPVSSEYTSNQETFKVTGGQLSPIWRKNPVYCRWSYEGSLSANDYPYILNNSLLFESHNRTTNTFDPNPNRAERNLDYFYTINSSSPKYSHHTLHIEKSDIYGIDTRFDFRHDSYEGLTKYVAGTTSVAVDYDYFSTILNLKSAFDNGRTIKNTKKYSTFISGDNSTPNYTLFRGIKFSLYDINNIKTDQNGQIETINTTNKNTFENYKFSIVLTAADNGMQWDIIDRWKMDRKYLKGDIVIHDDILYIAANDTICDSPSVLRWGREEVADTQNPTGLIYSKYLLKPAPYNMLAYTTTSPADKVPFRVWENYDSNITKAGNDWLIYQPNDEAAIEIFGSIFWSPLDELETKYNNRNVVYKDGDYYRFDEVGSISFWNPLYAIRLTVVSGDPDNKSERRGYSAGIIVLYNKSFYKSKKNNNMYPPENQNYWEKIDYEFKNSKWKPVPVWIPNTQYTKDSYVIHNGTLYKADTVDNVIPFNTIPNKSKLWTRMYSLGTSTNIIYGRKYNSIILHNGEYYRIVNNPNASTLDNGIKIYINHRYKNVLVNIYVNDNTIPNLKNSNRDQMYTSINKKLTAKNFIESLNNLTLRNGFSDYIKYVVIDENGIKKQYGYGSNLTKLPHLLLAERPEQVLVKVDSLEVIPINETKLKPKKTLIDGRITEITQLNHFNNTHVAVDILQTNDTPSVIKNYSGMTSLSDNVIFRFSGNYMPLFYDVQLFNTDNSIEYKRIDLIFEISCKQNVNFKFDVNGTKLMNSYDILPGASFSNTFDYYTQIVPILNDNVTDVEFLYEVLDKSREKRRIGEILDLDDDSFNKNDSIWYDMGHNEGMATLVPGTASPVHRTSDLYPGNHFEFFGSNNLVSIMETSTPSDNALSFEFFIKFSDVDTLSVFMGNGKLFFGVQGKRVFMKNDFEDGTSKAIYTDPVLENDVWYHIVFSRSYSDGVTTAAVFIDGRNAVATDSATGLKYDFMIKHDKKYELVNTSKIEYVIGGSKPGMQNEYTTTTTINTATIISTPIGGGLRQIISVVVTGNYSTLTKGTYLDFTYGVSGFNLTTHWTGTVDSVSYDPGTNKTTILPYFGSTIPTHTTINNTGNRTVIFGTPKTSYTFSGCISSIRLYDRVLGESEVREYFVAEHKTLSIKYRATEGDIKLELHTDEPRLILNIETDPSISYYNLQVGATGGNTPYMFSVNGGQYSYTPTYFTNLQKNTTLNVTVKDFIGLTSSAGYYTVNGDINSIYEFSGAITY